MAIFAASKNTILYYTSTVNCPGFQHTQSSGAQFDIQSGNINTRYLNLTQGYASSCSAIEFRYTSDCFFKFQTISEMSCMFAIAFTEVEADNLELSYSNIFNISLVMEKNATKLPNFYPGTIHVEDADKITIDHFCFYNIDFGPNNTNSKLVSRGVDSKVNKVQPIHIVLIDCTYDCSNYYIAVEYSPNVNNQVLINCKSNTVKSNLISYLNLGECQGKVTPNPLIISNDNNNQIH